MIEKTRLQRTVPVQQEPPPVSQDMMAGAKMMADVGKRTGQIVGGMASFYGGMMNKAVDAIRKKESRIVEPPFG